MKTTLWRVGIAGAATAALAAGTMVPATAGVPERGIDRGAQQPGPGAAVAAEAGGSAVSTARKRKKYRICDQWDGVWDLRINNGNGQWITGRVEIDVYNHERAVGHYRTTGANGVLRGELQNRQGDPKVCGRRWEGSFKDQSGQYRNKGKFWAMMEKDDDNWFFYGQYKPCRIFCYWNDWYGTYSHEND